MPLPLPLTGGCQCGTVRYAVRGQPLALYACHCTDCQRQSASGFGLSLTVAKADLVFTAGQPRMWPRTTARGTVTECTFCGDCGTRLVHARAGNTARVSVKPGTLDDTSWLDPVGHIWARSAQPWIKKMLEGPLVFDEQPADISVFFDAWKARRA